MKKFAIATRFRSLVALSGVLLLAAGVGVSVNSPQPAHALEDWTWSAPETLSNSEFPWGGNPDVPLVIDSQGRMTAIWSSSVNDFDVLASSSSLNGVDWTDPVRATPANKSADDPVIAGDNSGRVTALWLDQSGANPTIWSNTFDGESWLPAVKVTPNEGRYDNLAIVADSTGLVTALWENQGACSIDASTSADGQTWTTAVPITTDSNRCPWAPQIVVDDSDRLTAIWNADDGQVTEYIVVEASTSTTPGSWGQVEVLSTVGEDARHATLATTAGGLAVAAWQTNYATGPAIKSRSSQSGATWSPLESHGGASDGYPSIAAGPSGTVLLSWVAGDDGSGGLLVSSSNNGSSWTSPARISPEGDYAFGDPARLSEDSCGQFIALWTGADETGSFFIQSSTSVNGVEWTSPVNPDSAADLAFMPRLVEDAHGRVTAVWPAVMPASQTVLMQSSTLTKPACGASPGGLADTGADASVAGTSVAVSAGLIVAGALVLALMRRRRNLGG